MRAIRHRVGARDRARPQPGDNGELLSLQRLERRLLYSLRGFPAMGVL